MFMDFEHVMADGRDRRPLVSGSMAPALLAAVWAGSFTVSTCAAPSHAHTEQGAPIQTTAAPLEPVILAPGLGVQTLTEDIDVVDFAMGHAPGGFAPGVYAVVSDSGELLRITSDGDVEVFSQLGGPPLVHPMFGAENFGGLAVQHPAGDTTVLDANGQPRGVTRTPVPRNVRGAAVDTAGDFGGQAFVIDAPGVIYRFASEGLTPIGYGPAAADAMLIGVGPGFDSHMYFADAAHSIVWRRAADGTIVAWADLSRRAIAPTGLAIDADGGLGIPSIFVLDAAAGCIIRLDASGRVIDVVLTGLVNPSAITIPPDGPFAGQLLIADAGRVLVVHPQPPASP